MKCSECRHGRRMIRNGHLCVECVLYGIILKADHECDRKGAERRERDEDLSQDGGGEARLQEDRGGAA